VPDAGPVVDDAGITPPPDASGPSDSGTPPVDDAGGAVDSGGINPPPDKDAGATSHDGGITPPSDGGSKKGDGGGGGTFDPPPNPSGCGCAVPGSSAPLGGAGVPALILGMAILVRRRQTRRTRSVHVM
jgi:MYXO-CTERM domain-containing protein